MTPETLARLEKMYAEVWPSAPAEIYQSFKDLAEALKEAWAAQKPSGHDAKTCCCPDCCTLRQARQERDEARAMVKKLNRELTNYRNMYTVGDAVGLRRPNDT